MAKRPDIRDALLEVADLIERFINGPIGPWEWDDFISVGARNPVVETLRVEATAVSHDFPPTHSGEWCSQLGRERLQEIADRVRNEADQ